MNITLSGRTLLIGAAIVALLAAAAGLAAWRHIDAHNQTVVTLTEQQAQSQAELARVVGDSQRQAADLQAELERTKAENPRPVDVTTVQAPTTDQAAAKVAAEIRQNNRLTPDAPPLPPADTTLVKPVPTTNTVEVYRITLDKARLGVNALVLAGGGKRAEIGLGPSWKNRDYAVNVGYTTEGRFYLVAVRYW